MRIFPNSDLNTAKFLFIVPTHTVILNNFRNCITDVRCQGKQRWRRNTTWSINQSAKQAKRIREQHRIAEYRYTNKEGVGVVDETRRGGERGEGGFLRISYLRTVDLPFCIYSRRVEFAKPLKFLLINPLLGASADATCSFIKFDE